jgi:hypothetical protein
VAVVYLEEAHVVKLFLVCLILPFFQRTRRQKTYPGKLKRKRVGKG